MAKDNWVKQESAGLWLPEAIGDEIIGTVAKVEEGTYGQQWTIKTDSGEEHRTPSHKVLQSRMAKIVVGDRVKIVYEKEEPPKLKGQNPTKIYAVYKQE